MENKDTTTNIIKKFNYICILFLIGFLYLLIVLGLILIYRLSGYTYYPATVQHQYWSTLAFDDEKLLRFIFIVAIVSIILIVTNLILALTSINQIYSESRFLSLMKVILKIKQSLIPFHIFSLNILNLFISWEILSDWPNIILVVETILAFSVFLLSAIYSVPVIHKLYVDKILTKKQFILKVFFQFIVFIDIISYMNLYKNINKVMENSDFIQ